MTNLKIRWAEYYAQTEAVLANMRRVKAVATAFNTNIDAVLKISGKKLAELVKQSGMNWQELNDIESAQLKKPKDVLKGVFRCFSKGIAEEWLVEDIQVYEWLVNNIGYDRLQLGGQGGIVANVMAVCGVQEVYVHCNSLPKQQAEQFLKLDNLLSFNEKGEVLPAYQIDRKDDVPLIHWIIEFDRSDVFELGEYRVSCPKSNRFIATYDPLNSRLVMDENFVDYLNNHPTKAIILSGYHALTAAKNGVALVEGSLPVIKRWQNDGALIHLEVASTQDKEVRRAIVGKIAALADSIGLNERETIDVLEVIDEEEQAALCEADPSGVNLFEGILRIKQKVGCKRLQMHMYGLYITLQDKDFVITPERNREGMCLAAMIAAGKAGTGSINEAGNLLWAKGQNACDCGLRELAAIAGYIGDAGLLSTGIGRYRNLDVIAIPTILIEKPLTLVGMGDTISSVSFIAAL